MNAPQPQIPKFELLELSWWDYPHTWIGLGVLFLLLVLIGAYWWWLRLQKARRPKTPIELLRLQLAELDKFSTWAPQTYQEQQHCYEALSRLLEIYLSVCAEAPHTETTDAERLDWMRGHLSNSELVTQCETVIVHGQQVKFAGQVLDPDVVCSDVKLMIDLVRKELERCQ